jgi:hypothetical protein
MDLGANVLVLALLFVMMYFVPRMIRRLRRQNIGVLGQELIPLAFPALSAFCLYQGDMRLGIGLGVMSAGYFLGVFLDKPEGEGDGR